MKHLSGLWHKLTVVVAVTAALSSCNRAEYAMLPKTTSYHGTANRAVAVAPAAPATTPAEVAATEVLPTAVSATTPALAPATVAATTKAPQEAAPAVVAAPTKKAIAAPKLTLMQKALVQKLAKKVDKLASKAEFKQKTETAEVSRLSGKLRQGIILIIVGLLVGLLAFIPGLGTLFGILSTILVVIGAVLIVLYLLDEL